MLVAKAGIIKQGIENSPYKSLVWLGSPANVASKLTDTANKTTYTTVPTVQEGLYFPATQKWLWMEKEIPEFLSRLEVTYTNTLRHKDEYFCSFFTSSRIETKAYPPILMTERVYNGFKTESPDDESVKEDWWRNQSVSGVDDRVVGGNVWFKVFK